VEVRFWCCSDFNSPRASQGIEREITSSGICLRCSSFGRNSLGKLPVAASLPWQADGRRDTVVTRHRRCHATAASSDFFCVLSIVQGSTYIVHAFCLELTENDEIMLSTISMLSLLSLLSTLSTLSSLSLLSKLSTLRQCWR
jgi:hypothetical protein